MGLIKNLRDYTATFYIILNEHLIKGRGNENELFISLNLTTCFPILTALRIEKFKF